MRCKQKCAAYPQNSASIFSSTLNAYSLFPAAQFLRRWFSGLVQTVTQTRIRSGKRRKIEFTACRSSSGRRVKVDGLKIKALVDCPG